MSNSSISGRPSRRVLRAATAAAVESLETRTLFSFFQVATNGDSGSFTLRSAILQANSNPGPDQIVIQFFTTQPRSIKLLSALPAITGPTTVSLQDSGPVTLDGALAPATADGLVLSGSNIQVTGLAFTNFHYGLLSSGTGNVVQNATFTANRAAGVATLPGASIQLTNSAFVANGAPQIDLNGDGPTPNDADDTDGVPNFPVLTSATSTANRRAQVTGTFHGPASTAVTIELFTDTPSFAGRRGGTFSGTTDANGDLTFSTAFSAGNADTGRQVYAAATYAGRTSELSAPVTIPGPIPLIVTTAADAGPGSLRQAVLDANARPGGDVIYFELPKFPTAGVVLASPLPDVAGPLAIHGVSDPYYGLLRIAGPGSGAYDGLVLRAGGSAVDTLTVTGFRHGIVIDGPGGNVIGAPDAPVRIQDNSGDAIRILGDSTGNDVANALTANNGGLPLDLGGDGPTPNHPADADNGGANHRQNHPVVTSARRDATTLAVTGSLDASPGVYRVDLYVRPYQESSFDGFNSSTYLGAATTTVDLSGHATFTATFPAGAFTRECLVAATATRADTGDTSEFSAPTNVDTPHILVTSPADAGPGTLRQAILDANASTDPITIAFDLPGDGTQLIALASPLPTITGPVSIDGATQHGFAGTPLVELAGKPGFDGITLAAAATDAQVRNLALGNFARAIVVLGGRDTNTGATSVYGCYIGFDAAGNAFANDTGIYAEPSNLRVGGTLPGLGNVIAGNDTVGLDVVAGFDTTVVRGNLIGTDPTGARAIPNGVGIRYAGDGYLTVGGTVAAARNVISGNLVAGAQIGLYSGSASIQGNYVGVAADGESPLPNGDGLQIDSGATIGGTLPEARNIIAGNRGVGLSVSDKPRVLGNYIGLTASGKPLGNGGDGIRATGKATIGGVNPGEGNVIAYNGGAGIAVLDVTDYFGNHPAIPVRGNAIYANAGLPLDLNADGPTPNDATDADAGPNALQNFPVLATAITDATSTTVTGSIQSAPNRILLLDFYAGPAGQPQTYLGSAQVTTAADGKATFSAILAKRTNPTQTITATATDRTGASTTPFANTSEFAATIAVTDVAPPAVVSSAYNPALRQLTFTFSRDVAVPTADALYLAPRTPGVDPATLPVAIVAYDPATRTATFTLPESLPIADYRATLSSSAVHDTAGRPMTSDATLDFFHLPGDTNRDRKVDFTDLLTLARNYNTTAKTYADGDLTGDGLVNFADLLILARNYNQSLPAPAPAMMAAASPTPAPVTAIPTPAKTKPAGAKKPTPVFSTQPVAPRPKPVPPKPKPKHH